MNRDDIIRMAREHHMQALPLDCYAGHIVNLESLVKAAFDAGAAAERDECASIEVKITVPERDYDDLSPKEIYEEALIDASLAFRSAIRARGQE